MPDLNPQPIPPGFAHPIPPGLMHPGTTIEQLRQHFGPSFAQDHGPTDTLGQLLTTSGSPSLEDYVSRARSPQASTEHSK